MNEPLQIAITISSFFCFVGAGLTCHITVRNTYSKGMTIADAVNAAALLVYFISFAFFLQRWVH